MYCQFCGKEKTGEGKFCQNCGAVFSVETLSKQIAKPSIVPSVFVAIILVIAILSDSLDIGYFTFLRWVIFAASFYYAYFVHKKEQKLNYWFWNFIILAILFNPIVPVYLERDTWVLFDFITLILFVVHGYKIRK